MQKSKRNKQKQSTHTDQQQELSIKKHIEKIGFLSKT